MIPYLLVGAALLLLFSPWALRLGAQIITSRPASPRDIGYQSAIADLANVRKRLLDTKTLTDDAKKAIDTLTLALVAGSDQ